MPALRSTRKSAQNQPEMAVIDSVGDSRTNNAVSIKAQRQSTVEVSIPTRRTRSSTSNTASLVPNGVDRDETEDEDWADGDVNVGGKWIFTP